MKKLKNKILLGLTFLLFVTILLSLAGILSILYLSKDSKAIIADNYASVEYSNKMSVALNNIFLTILNSSDQENKRGSIELGTDQLLQCRKDFESNLRLQQNNITEPGENTVVNEISEAYSYFIALTDSLNNNLREFDQEDFAELKNRFIKTSKAVEEIHSLNMGAIQRKSDTAARTADKVMIYMALSAGAGIFITIIFIIYFPGYIILPITELTKRIKEISRKKYDQRIVITAGDELKNLAEAFNEMASGLKKHEAERINELLFEKRRMETLILNLKDGILLLNNRSEVLLANDKFCEITSLKKPELLGIKIKDFVLENPVISRIKSIDLNSTERDSKPFEIKTEDKTQYYQIRILDLGKGERTIKETGGYIVLVQNITEYQERDLAKTNLMAAVSHELKTPLSSINLSVKLLEDERIGHLNEEQKKLTESIRLHSSRILNLVNEVLDFAQSETGHITLKIRSNDVHDIIELGTFAVLMQINERQIDLVLNIPENLPMVKCDLEKTVWIIVNLLNNAVRYSPHKGKIFIEAEYSEKFVTFSVRDEGSGISPEDQKRLFEKYVKSKTDPAKGSGLGLAIAKEFVEVQGGIIGVESIAGKGSRFYFTLPAV